MKDEDGVERCDVCLTWVATHEVQVGDVVYCVCDKPRCQDKVDAIQEESVEQARSMMSDRPQGFPAASICRADLEQLGFTQEHITPLTDEDMEQIAWLMEDRSCDEGYWEALKDCTNRVLAGKEHLHD